MTRAVLAGVAIVLWLCLLLVMAAGLHLGDPWRAHQQSDLSGSTLGVIAGQATANSDGLVVSELGQYAQGLQSWQLAEPLDAAQFPLLRYTVHDFPRSLELALIFRTAEHPEDVASVSLPWQGDGGSAVDLSRLPGWQGQVIEIGFSEYPMPSVAPPDMPFHPFTLGGAKLESRSLRGQWQVLMSDWFAWQPWSMRSINAVRSASARPWQRSLPLILFLAVAGSLLLLSLFRVLRGRSQLLRLALALLVLAWLMLDFRWLGQLQRNNMASHELYQGKPWAERSGMVSDSPLQARAEHMRSTLAQQKPGVHVLVWSPSQTDSIRLGYFLRPYNVASLFPGMQPGSVPDGNLLLVDNADMSWTWDSRRSLLQRGGFSVHGDLLWRQDGMLLLSVRKGAGP